MQRVHDENILSLKLAELTDLKEKCRDDMAAFVQSTDDISIYRRVKRGNTFTTPPPPRLDTLTLSHNPVPLLSLLSISLDDDILFYFRYSGWRYTE